MTTAFLVSRVEYRRLPPPVALGGAMIQGCGAPTLVPVATIFTQADAEDFAQVAEDRTGQPHVTQAVRVPA